MVEIIFFLATFLVYLFSSAGNTVFNHFVLLADAFLKGNLFVTAHAPWLEQVPIDVNHFFVVYPPAPAIIFMPLVKIFGTSFPQQYLAHLFGAVFTFAAMKISLKVKKDTKLMIYIGLFSALGNIVWFLSSVGSSWYLSQVVAAAFIMLAINELLGKKRELVIGILLGAAYLGRIDTILSLPFFLFALKDKNFIKRLFLIGIGILPFFIFNSLYNFLRFGVIWDKAYTLIPGLSTEPWYQKGIFNISYIPSHLKVMFASFPIFKNAFPYAVPSFGGLAIWITSPVFVYSLFANIKERIVKLSWVAIVLISLLIFSHGSTGFSQFGYRFAVDFYPFLILLTIKGISKTGLKWHHWVLLVISILVNAWGVILTNKFG
jgi:hypothetical protein